MTIIKKTATHFGLDKEYEVLCIRTWISGGVGRGSSSPSTAGTQGYRSIIIPHATNALFPKASGSNPIEKERSRSTYGK
jgi:hypothetical protein